MRRLAVLVTFLILVSALLISGLSGTTPLVADTGVSDNDKASSVSGTDDSRSAWDWGIYIAFGALIVSIASAVWNYRHSESLFHRREYPAVLWHKPEASRKGLVDCSIKMVGNSMATQGGTRP